MIYLIDSLADAGRWSIEYFWLPILAWTAIALPLFIFLRYSSRAPAQVRYGLASALITALPAGLLGAVLFSLSSEISPPLRIITLPNVAIFDGAAAANDLSGWTMAHVAGVLFTAATTAAVWRACRLLAAGLQLRRLRSSVAASRQPQLQRQVDAMKSQFGISVLVSAVVSSRATAPMTFGWIKPVIVIPETLRRRPVDLRLALLHELIHIRRRDYVAQWSEQLVGALFVIHPLVAMLRHETSFLREVICDTEVVRHTGVRSTYARLLYSFSTSDRAPWHLAVGIFLKEQHLKKRITAMNNLIDITRTSYANRLGILVAVVIFGISASLVACTEQFVETDAAATESVAGKNSESSDVFSSVDEMPQIKGGFAAIQANLVYPESAKDAGIEGRVLVTFVVDEKGEVQDAEITEGVGSGLDEAALKAVELTKFEPGIHGGKAVKVRMALPITFKLSSGAEKTQK